MAFWALAGGSVVARPDILVTCAVRRRSPGICLPMAFKVGAVAPARVELDLCAREDLKERSSLAAGSCLGRAAAFGASLA